VAAKFASSAISSSRLYAPSIRYSKFQLRHLNDAAVCLTLRSAAQANSFIDSGAEAGVINFKCHIIFQRLFFRGTSPSLSPFRTVVEHGRKLGLYCWFGPRTERYCTCPPPPPESPSPRHMTTVGVPRHPLFLSSVLKPEQYKDSAPRASTCSQYGTRTMYDQPNGSAEKGFCDF
jgi:hypothetical protein